MKAIRYFLLNGGRLVVVACKSGMKATHRILLIGDRLVVGACGSDMKAIPFLFAQRWSACGRRLRVGCEGLSFFFAQR